MTTLLGFLDSFVLSGIGSNVAADLLKAAWERANQKPWEDLYLDAFKKSFDELRPGLQQYSDGEISLNLDLIRKILSQDLHVSVDQMSISSLSEKEFSSRLGKTLSAQQVLTIGGNQLNDEDYSNLIFALLSYANEIFFESVQTNELAFRKAMLLEARENKSIVEEILEFLSLKLGRTEESLQKLDQKSDIQINHLRAIQGEIKSIKEMVSQNSSTQPTNNLPLSIANPVTKTEKEDMLIDFAIITALEIEAQAVVRRLDNHQIVHFESQDIRTYHLGTISIDGTTDAYRVVIVLLPSMGEISAANAVTDTLARWNPRYLIMLGIAGGIPQDDLDLGDVVVADQVVGYEYGKVTDAGFRSRDRVYPASALLLERIRNFWDRTWCDQVETNRPLNAKRSKSKLFVGPIASGNKVIASTEFREGLLKHWPKLVAVEMEAEGVYASAFDRPQIVATLVIRGICDMADERKSDAWQEYAANAAAAFLTSFLKSKPIDLHVNVEVSISVSESTNTATSSKQGDLPKTLKKDYYFRLREVLLQCEPMEGSRQLRAIFAHPDLRPWQNSLPEASNITERVELIIDYLLPQHHRDGRKVIVTFLRIMGERIDPEIETHHLLDALAKELECTTL